MSFLPPFADLTSSHAQTCFRQTDRGLSHKKEKVKMSLRCAKKVSERERKQRLGVQPFATKFFFFAFLLCLEDVMLKQQIPPFLTLRVRHHSKFVLREESMKEGTNAGRSRFGESEIARINLSTKKGERKKKILIVWRKRQKY